MKDVGLVGPGTVSTVTAAGKRNGSHGKSASATRADSPVPEGMKDAAFRFPRLGRVY